MDVVSKKSSKVALELHWKPKSIENLEKYYNKPSLEDTISTAKELGKVYQFKK